MKTGTVTWLREMAKEHRNRAIRHGECMRPDCDISKEGKEAADRFDELANSVEELAQIKQRAKELYDKWQDDNWTDTGEANELLIFILKED